MKELIARRTIWSWSLWGAVVFLQGQLFSQGIPPAAEDTTAVHILVCNAKGEPLPQAVLTIKPTEEAASGWLLREVTKAKGEAQFDLPVAGTRFSPYVMKVEHDGYLPHLDWLNVDHGVPIERQITLHKPVVTHLQFLDERGRPVADVNLTLQHPLDGSQHFWAERTDANGQAVFVHPAFVQSFELVLGHTTRTIEDQPIITICLTDEELQAIVPSRRVSGKVLRPDGQAGAGWFVAVHPVPTGAGGAYGGPVVSSYTAPELIPVADDGTFATDVAEDRLFIVSPDGIPFLYPLNPRSWPAELRRLTVRIPALRRTRTGQLVQQDGQPAAGVEILINEIRSNSRHWTLKIGEPYSRETVPPSHATAADGVPVGHMASDNRGEYRLPFYFGSQIEYRLPIPFFHIFQGLEADEKVVLQSYESIAPLRTKRITLHFTDEVGRAIPDMHVQSCDGEKKGKVIERGGGANEDGRGGQFFYVGTNLDRLAITALASNWNIWKTNFPVSGPADETIALTVSEEFRQQPSRGQVLAPDGAPLAGVTVRFEPHDPRQRSRLWTKTDARGRFYFEHTPEAGTLELHRRLEDGGPLPGWTDPPPVTASRRNVTIQLHSGGSVRVRLPAGLKIRPAHLGLSSEKGMAGPSYYSLAGDTNGLHATHLQPGTYRVVNSDPRTFGAISNVTVTVRANEESVLDLSGERYRPPEEGPQSWTTVRVVREGVPFGGAIVNVFPDQPDRREKVISDLSDDAGQVRFLGQTGRRYVVAARVPGRCVGWTATVLASNQVLSVELQPARTLVVQLEPDRRDRQAGYDFREAWLRFKDLPDDEAKALFYALNLSQEGFFSWQARFPEARAPLLRDGRLTRIVEDLPLGHSVSVQVKRADTLIAETAVLISAGQSRFQELRIPSGQFEPNPKPADKSGAAFRSWAIEELRRLTARKLKSQTIVDSPSVWIGEAGGRWKNAAEPTAFRGHVTRIEIDFVSLPPGGLECLEAFPDLETLSLHVCEFHDEDLQPLAHLIHLRKLSLVNAPITGEGLVYLHGLTNLEEINLNGSAVTSESLANLRGLPNLKKLHLQSVRKISNKVFDELAQMKRVEWVDLLNTPVTQKAIAAFKSAHPNIQVVP